jgi:acyl-CoA oxidase
MFNDVQDHVLKTAQTHIERVVLEAFVAGVDRTTDSAAKELLDKLCDLYALSAIEADKAWFLEHGQLTPSRAKLLTTTVNQLHKELRPHIVTLVDAFAIPAEWKAAQILEEEPERQEAMAARDAEVRSEAEGSQAPDESATDLEVAPAQ